MHQPPSLSFPDSLKVINGYAFNGCAIESTSFQLLTIIGEHAFYECLGIPSVTFRGSLGRSEKCLRQVQQSRLDKFLIAESNQRGRVL